jgi:hypothetical protein
MLTMQRMKRVWQYILVGMILVAATLVLGSAIAQTVSFTPPRPAAGIDLMRPSDQPALAITKPIDQSSPV